MLASFFLSDAAALKAVHKAGRRGGDSIAREGCKHVLIDCISLIEIVKVIMRTWGRIELEKHPSGLPSRLV